MSLSFYVEEPGPYSRLLQDRDRGVTVLKKSLSNAASDILSKGLINPFVYTVTREDENILGYLIGTQHCCNKASIETPIFQRIITKCDLLFMERLPCWYDSTPPSALAGRVTFKCPPSDDILTRFGLDLSMDESLCALARSHNTECRELETEDEAKQRVLILREAASHSANLIDYDSPAKRESFIVWHNSRSEEERALEFAEFYQFGKAQLIHNFFMSLLPLGILQISTFKPNVLWTERSIIPSLAYAEREKKTICIMVGAAHLLGAVSAPEQTGIIKLLRAKGFKVTRITAEAAPIK